MGEGRGGEGGGGTRGGGNLILRSSRGCCGRKLPASLRQFSYTCVRKTRTLVMIRVVFHRLAVVQVSPFCSLIKGITPNICMLCFCPDKCSVLLCVWLVIVLAKDTPHVCGHGPQLG